jgi:DNA-binding GntR family transcriptional regulator
MEKINAEEMVYDELKDAIIQRRLYPNMQLTEASIAEKMGVSRTPIRGALKRLEYDGLVRIIPNKGAFVAQPSIDEYKDIFACRLLLEREAAGYAAEKITDEELHEYGEYQALEKIAYKNRDFAGFVSANNSMHMIIAKASGNAYYIKYIKEQLLKSTIYLVHYDTFYTKSYEELNSVGEHERLIKALLTRDKKLARFAMEEHIKSIFENLNLASFENDLRF